MYKIGKTFSVLFGVNTPLEIYTFLVAKMCVLCWAILLGDCVAPDKFCNSNAFDFIRRILDGCL